MQEDNYVILVDDVKVRKYEVDMNALSTTLRNARERKILSIKDISNKLQCPKTMVEHWFRTDKYQSIPEDYIWFDLKELLEIKTNYFDAAITTFEIRPGVFDMEQRVYLPNSVYKTLSTEQTVWVIECTKM